jgi:hypothetical protein
MGRCQIAVIVAALAQKRVICGALIHCEFPPSRYYFDMSFTELLEELPALTVAERQILIRRALELDDSPLSSHEEGLIDERLAAHRRDVDSSVPLDEMKKRMRSGLDR